MKKKIIIISGIVLVLALIVAFFLLKNKKFYVEDKYYNSNEYVLINSKELNKIIDNKESALVFVYNDFCTLPVPCDLVFKTFMEKNNISMLKIKFKEYKKTDLYKSVKYAPTVLVIKEGKIKSYLNAESDKDLTKYQNAGKFKEWVFKYIHPTK